MMKFTVLFVVFFALLSCVSTQTSQPAVPTVSSVLITSSLSSSAVASGSVASPSSAVASGSVVSASGASPSSAVASGSVASPSSAVASGSVVSASGASPSSAVASGSVASPSSAVASGSVASAAVASPASGNSTTTSSGLYLQVETPSQIENDNRVLNYALTLEHLEYAFYTQGLARFSQADFQAAGYSASVYAYITLIRAHESAHVDALTAVLVSRNATAVPACTYNFNASLSSVANFLATARVLEETGVSAYDGGANAINNAALLQTAATIATVEARHAAYLNQLVGQTPFPNNFDMAMTPTQVIQAASQFIVSCPNTLTLPVIAYTLVPLSSNATYRNVSGQPETQAQFDNDNRVLNYSLYLELFGHAFYGNVSRFTTTDFINAGYSVAVYNQFQMIITHENAHLAFLQQALSGRNASQTAPCTYNLGDNVATVANALAFARTLENLEVTAYDGAINALTDYNLIQGAATIATVEARHGEYLNNLLTGVGIQNATFDAANSPATILNLTASFFGPDCVAPALPQQAFIFQALGAVPFPSANASTASPAAASPSTVAVSPSAAAASPSAAAASPSAVAASPSAVAASPSAVAASTSSVPASPSAVAASVSSVPASPSAVAASPSAVPASPSAVPASPSAVSASPSAVAASPSAVPASPSAVAASPSAVAASPSAVPASPSAVPASPSTVAASVSSVPASPSSVPASPSAVAASPSSVPASPSSVPASPSSVPASPSAVAASISSVPASPSAVAASPSAVAASPSSAPASPSAVPASPSAVAASPSSSVVASRSAVLASPSTVAVSPSSVAASPSSVAASPSTVAATPSPSASINAGNNGTSGGISLNGTSSVVPSATFSPVPSTPSVVPSATFSPVPSSSVTSSPSATSSPTVSPSSCPVTVSPSPTPSPCSSDDDDDSGKVVINFYFADMLRM